MAKNWTMKEALEAVVTNDKEGMQDLGRRFPLTAIALGKGDITTIINALPDHITARKIESVLKDGIVESTDEDVEDTEDEVEEIKEEKPAKKEKAAKKEKPAKVKKEEPIPEPIEEEEEEEEEEESKYASMNAVELFKLCKKRGIKTEPKQKSEVYIKLLEADDNKVNGSDSDDDDDDWDI